MTDAQHIGSDAFARSLRDCLAADTPEHLAVACSGGPDSMALTALLKDWCADAQCRLTALIVDHGLRAESAGEAAQVQSWLRTRDVDAVILTRSGDAPQANIQAAARQARYRLLLGWCLENGVHHLALAHHREDQAETVLSRLARGSGVEGLSAMRPRSMLADPETGLSVAVLRPALGLQRAGLRSLLTAKGWPSVHDPSNDSDAFQRVRLRRLMPALAGEGLDAERLARTAEIMARASEVLDAAAAEAFDRLVRVDRRTGHAVFDPAAFSAFPIDTRLRLLARLAALVSGNRTPPRLRHLEAAADALSKAPDGQFRGRTFVGCRLVPVAAGCAMLREARALPAPVPARERQCWDGRFRLALSGRLNGVTIGPLGRDGVAALRRSMRDRPLEETADMLAGLPHAALQAVPALFSSAGILAVPTLGLMPGNGLFSQPDGAGSKGCDITIQGWEFVGDCGDFP